MGSSIWVMIGAIAISGIIAGVVSDWIKQNGGGKFKDRVGDLEDQVTDLEADLENARKRIEVLEKIVTDGKYDLKKQIDDLAS